MKRLLTLLLLVTGITTGLWALEQDGEGYYLIGTAKQLKDFAALVNNGETSAKGKLVADIDLAGDDDNQWTPIGTSTNKFNGTFDGQGFTVKNLYFKQEVENVGLFGFTNTATYIKNVRVEGMIDITNPNGSNTAGRNVRAGGIVAHAEGGVILNCSFAGSVASYSHTGGIVGWAVSNSVKVVNCYNEGTVIAPSNALQELGGIIGRCNNGSAINCYNVGDVKNTVTGSVIIYPIASSGSNCYYRNGCCQSKNGSSWSNGNGGSGTAMSVEDMKAEAFVTTLNTNVKGLLETYPDICEWSMSEEGYPIHANRKDNNHIYQDAEGYYLLTSADDWKAFAELVKTTPTANAKMTADINLGDDQTMIGSGTEDNNDGAGNILFQGVFDGQGHTLDINYQVTEDFVAPFRHIQNATIKNLRVTGHIYTTKRYAGGIVSCIYGNQIHSYITNCISSVNIHSSYVNTGDFYNGARTGGIAASLKYYGQLHIDDCIFNGSISGETQKVLWGGFLGLPDGTVTISNSLQVGTFDCEGVISGSNGSGTFSSVFSNGYASRVNVGSNNYYLNQMGNKQGTQATDEQLADGTIATALQAGREEEVWVQDPETNQPMLKVFAGEPAPMPTPDGLTKDEEGYYILTSADDWKLFAELVMTEPTSNARMTADIDLGNDQTMVGTASVPYQGAFDGQGHTLTVNYDMTTYDVALAPFACVGDATIQNLHVDGSIIQRRCAAGGVAGTIKGNLSVKKCWVSAYMYVQGEGNLQGTIGGIASYCDDAAVKDKKVLIEDCLFSGHLGSGYHCGGLMSHVNGYYNNSAELINCLNLGTCNGIAGSTGTFIRTGVQGDPYTITNCYYKTAWGAVQGTQATTEQLANGATATALQAGRSESVWVQEGDQPMLKVFAGKNIRGDVNGDGLVNGTDIQAIINLIVAGEYDAKADVNGDGIVNGTDIQEVINIIVKGD